MYNFQKNTFITLKKYIYIILTYVVKAQIKIFLKIMHLKRCMNKLLFRRGLKVVLVKIKIHVSSI